MRSVGVSSVGKVRTENQDEIFYSDQPVGQLNNLYIVADGMGGHKAGGYASSYAVKRFVELIEQSEDEDCIENMKAAIHIVNEEIVEKCEEESYEGMGTTFVAATMNEDVVTVMNIGDSRLYYADKDMKQITVDHSYVEELVQAGAIEEKQAKVHPKKNLITRAVGVQSVTPDFFQFEAKEGYLLLCSDGLCNMLDDDEIKGFLFDHSQLENKASQMISKANEYGGKDNISLVIVDTKE